MFYSYLTAKKNQTYIPIFLFLCFFSLQSSAQILVEYADQNELLLRFENEMDTASINALKDSLQAVEVGVSPLTRVHLWKLSADTVLAYGGPLGVMNHALGKSIVQGADVNFRLRNDSLYDDGQDCYGNSFTCIADTVPIKIAIMDTGLDGVHPQATSSWFTRPPHDFEFQQPIDRIWKNGLEVPNNNIDDDENGYVDDEKGWDYPSNHPFPLDSNGHGTHVTGIIGKYLHTNLDSASQLIIMQTQDATGQGSLWHLVLSTDYALMQGAKVINWSLAYNAVLNTTGKDRILEYVINYGKMYHGALFVAAAGNSSLDVDANHPALAGTMPIQIEICPASFKNNNLMVVASGDCTGGLSSFSNYGKINVDIAAPGEDILSTYIYGQHLRFSGTSMAAPHVSVNAALMGTRQTEFHWKSIKQAMMLHSMPSAALNPVIASGKMLDFCSVYPPNNPLSVIVRANQTLCLGGAPITLNAIADGGMPGYSFAWSTGATSPNIITAAPGIYSVTVTDIASNTAVEDFTLTAISQPPIELQADTLDCYSTNASISVLNPSFGANYGWSNGSFGTDILVPPAGGIYTVTCTLASGCTATQSVAVIDNTLDFTLAKDTICRGDSAKITPNIIGGVEPFQYYWDTGSLDSSICVSPNASKRYYLTVVDAVGCTKVRSVRIKVANVPNIPSMPTTTICYCDTAQLMATGTGGTLPYNFLWSPGGMTISNPKVSPMANTFFYVTLTDANGCTKSRRTRVRVQCKPPIPISSSIDTSNSKVTFNWANKCGGIRHQISYRCDGAGSPWTFRTIPNTDDTTATKPITLPCPNLQWRIRTRCCNSNWSAYSPTVSFRPESSKLRIIEEENKPILSISPNPMQEFMWVDYENIELPATLTVFDMSGKIVHQEMIKAETSAQRITLDGSIDDGMYILSIENKTQSLTEKFIRKRR